MGTKDLLKTCSDKYVMAYKDFESFISKNSLSEHKTIDSVIFELKFSVFRGVLYSFFESNSIYITTTPYDINQKGCKWNYFIFLDGTEIAESEFDCRETAEYIAFLKSFQFLDTKLFIKYTQDRFYDQFSDVSCLNMDWNHLNKVLNYKRKNLLA